MYNIFQKAKVSAKVEVTNPEQPKEPAKANEETLTPEANLQKTIEKLKDSINSSFLTCEKYMVEEESSLKVRGESMVRSSSVTTSSMFTKFRSDLNFPPIINSQNYKQDKFLGLCRKERREAPKMPEMSGSNNNSSAPKPPPMNPGENVPIINEPTFQGAKPNFNFNNVTISEIPAKTQPGAGFIPPPPPLPISVVIANGIQMRKDGKMPDKTPVYFQPEVDSGPAVKDGTGADYRDQLSRMLSMKNQKTVDFSENRDSESRPSTKSILGTVENLRGSKINAGSFFDEDDDQPDETSGTQGGGTQKASNDEGSLFESILMKKKTTISVDESNPFAGKKPGPDKTRRSVFEEEAEEDGGDSTFGSKKDAKKKTIYMDSDEEENDQKRLLEKYSKTSMLKGRTGKGQEEGPEKDEETGKGKPANRGKGRQDSKLFDESDQEVKEKTKKEEKTQDASKRKNKLLMDSDEEVKMPAKPSKPEPSKTGKASKREESEEKKPKKAAKKDEEDEEMPARPKKSTVVAAPVKQVDSDQEKDEVAPKKAIKNSDFLSKLNSQLGQGPKEGAGILKSVLIEDENDEGPKDKEVDEWGPPIEDRPSIARKKIADRYFEQDEKNEGKKEPISEKKGKGKPETPEYAEEKKKEETKPVETPTGPVILRVKKTDRFASESEEDDKPAPKVEPPKPIIEKKETPVEPSGPVILRVKKKDKFASSSESESEKPAPVVKQPEKPKAPEVKAEPPAQSRKNKLLMQDSEEEQEVKKPLPKLDSKKRKDSDEEIQLPKKSKAKEKAPKEEDNEPPLRSSKLASKLQVPGDDSEEETKKKEAEKPKKPKKRLLMEDSEDEVPLPKPSAKTDTKKSKLFKKEDGSDDDLPPAPRKTIAPAKGGKKKLFDESD